MAGLKKDPHQTMDKNIIIDFHDVTFGFPEQGTLFMNLTLSIQKGGFYLVKGPSGAGKTTFLRLINRLENPNRGEIWFKGKPLGDYPPPQLRHSLLYIQQTPTVVDGSVHENLLLPFSFKNNHHLEKPDHHELKNLLKDVHLYDLGLNEHAMNLSVGQLQRICLIRGILLSPEVLLLDEPTSALDRDSAGSVMGLLEQLNVASGLTLLIITHKAYTPQHVEPRFLRVNHGRIEESG
jgi:UDP-glucose/iron transport system ATP-binding protein